MKASQGKWVLARHLAYLQRKILEVVSGKIRFLIVEMPPRHGKSEFISKYTTSWFMGNFPDKRIILASYEADFAASWGRKARNLLEEYGEEVFGVKIDKRSNAGNRWALAGHEGEMVTAGVGGAITGKGADLFIIDDPVKNASEAVSQTIQQRNIDWYESTARTRLEPGGGMIIIMTRWHDNDLVGAVLERAKEDPDGDQWVRVTFPAIALGEDELGRTENEALWPARYDIKDLLKIKSSMDQSWWDSLYQQDPVPPGGLIINEDDWQWYNWTDIKDEDLVFKFQSIDSAEKENAWNDDSVITDWGLTSDGKIVFRGGYAKRMKYSKLKECVTAKYWEYKPTVVGIEDKSSGTQLIQELQEDTSIPIIPIQNGNIDKEMNCRLAEPTVAAHKVYLPYNAPPDVKKAVETMLGQFKRFPKGKNDDWVDSGVNAIRFLARQTVKYAPVTGEDRLIMKLGLAPANARGIW